MRRWVHYHDGRLCFAFQLWNVATHEYEEAEHHPMTFKERIMWRLLKRFPDGQQGWR